MKENMQQIVDLLKEQVVNETLSLKGIEQVQKILEESTSLTVQLARQKEINIQHNVTISAVREELIQSQTREGVLKKRNEVLEQKEQEYYEQKIKFEYEQKRGEEMKEIVGMALRNPVITKSRVSTNFGNAVDANGYNQPVNDSGTETTTEEVE